jgi:hypothetical protein
MMNQFEIKILCKTALLIINYFYHRHTATFRRLFFARFRLGAASFKLRFNLATTFLALKSWQRIVPYKTDCGKT